MAPLTRGGCEEGGGGGGVGAVGAHCRPICSSARPCSIQQKEGASVHIQQVLPE